MEYVTAAALRPKTVRARRRAAASSPSGPPLGPRLHAPGPASAQMDGAGGGPTCSWQKEGWQLGRERQRSLSRTPRQTSDSEDKKLVCAIPLVFLVCQCCGALPAQLCPWRSSLHDFLILLTFQNSVRSSELDTERKKPEACTPSQPVDFPMKGCS